MVRVPDRRWGPSIRIVEFCYGLIASELHKQTKATSFNDNGNLEDCCNIQRSGTANNSRPIRLQNWDFDHRQYVSFVCHDSSCATQAYESAAHGSLAPLYKRAAAPGMVRAEPTWTVNGSTGTYVKGSHVLTAWSTSSEHPSQTYIRGTRKREAATSMLV